MVEVRDPIHGAIRLTAAETAVVDHPFVQRLRNVLQTGFAHLPFPGATHSRYSHCIGVAHLAGRAFDSAYEGWSFARPDARDAFRALVRIAALCHDLGHAPFSHCTEFAMPPLAALDLTWLGAPRAVRRATHEDYTLAILEKSDLGERIAAGFPFGARHVAALISADVTVDDDFFLDGGADHRRILSQIISSELDVDRLDYLVRDSYYSGARYGQIDVAWLLSNLSALPVDDRVDLALDTRALYAFDDFMIARHHMFLMVYFHHKSVVYEEMLRRYVEDPACTWSLPADLEAYLNVDDVALAHHLRGAARDGGGAAGAWARRLVERDPYRRVLEVHGTPEAVDLSREAGLLRDAGFDVVHAGSTGALSRYNVIGQKRERAPAIWVLERMGGMPVECVHELADATRVFQRYADARRIGRLYVAPERVEDARRLLGLPVS